MSKFIITVSADATLKNLADLYNALPATKNIKKFSSKDQAITRTTEALTAAFETDSPQDVAKAVGNPDLLEHVTVKPAKEPKVRSSGRNNAMHNHPVKVLTKDFVSRPNTMRQRMLQFIVDNDAKTCKEIMDNWFIAEAGGRARQDTPLIDANMFLVAVEKGILAPFTDRHDTYLVAGDEQKAAA